MRIALPSGAIVVLMPWILGTFHRGVIEGVSRQVREESVAGLTTYNAATRMLPASTEAVGTVEAVQIATVTSRVAFPLFDGGRRR